MKPIVCFVGPSGVGKTSYARRLVQNFNFQIPSVATTRKPRQDDGSCYIYLNESEFLRMISNGKFIEWDSYNGYYYGTLKESVLTIINSQKAGGCVLDLTPNGCRQVKATISETIIIALLPDDPNWPKKRLFERGTDDVSVIEQRTKILVKFIDEVKSLDAKCVYCNYSPKSWGPTFDEIVATLNLKQRE